MRVPTQAAVLVTSLFALVGGVPKKAMGASPFPAQLDVTERREGRLYIIQGHLSTHASPGTVWKVVSDYAALPSFISSMRRSEVMHRRGLLVEVEQVLHAQVFFLSKDVTLHLLIQELPPTHLAFRDALGKDFRTYSGTWDISTAGSETLLDYRLRAIPRQDFPGGIGEGALPSGVKRMLSEVRTEALRRESRPTPITPETSAL